MTHHQIGIFPHPCQLILPKARPLIPGTSPSKFRLELSQFMFGLLTSSKSGFHFPSCYPLHKSRPNTSALNYVRTTKVQAVQQLFSCFPREAHDGACGAAGNIRNPVRLGNVLPPAPIIRQHMISEGCCLVYCSGGSTPGWNLVTGSRSFNQLVRKGIRGYGTAPRISTQIGISLGASSSFGQAQQPGWSQCRIG